METEMELMTRVYATEPARTTTPRGDACIIPNDGLKDLIWSQARGSYQRLIALNLQTNGFVIGYKAQGDVVRGKAKSYKGRYETSLHNFAERVNDRLPGRYRLEYDRVGPKGAWGYRLTDEV